MNWVVKVSDDAQLFINQLPPKARRQVTRSISQMEQDPFHGDVLPLQGEEWKGYYRKRTGDYRICFFRTAKSASLMLVGCCSAQRKHTAESISKLVS
jgi:mRNA-degrading endonuclease RelE of RelBE toxin-antitoxin system